MLVLTKEGEITVAHYGNPKVATVRYHIAYTEYPSRDCIDGGRVLRATLWEDGDIVCSYDRRWRVAPVEYSNADLVMRRILREYDKRIINGPLPAWWRVLSD
jgi:hypothetical protein